MDAAMKMKHGTDSPMPSRVSNTLELLNNDIACHTLDSRPIMSTQNKTCLQLASASECFFAFAINFISLLFILYHPSYM